MHKTKNPLTQNLQLKIEAAWENIKTLTPSQQHDLKPSLTEIFALLDSGKIRVSDPLGNHQWHTHEWIKKAILLSFKVFPSHVITGGPGKFGQESSVWYDKVDLKCAGWTAHDFETHDFRSVPGSIIRKSAYIGPQAIIMPSFINVGAYVGAGTLVDTWVTIGSCAQIGSNCHISGGVGIGGVLEPLQDSPVVIEDNCFIGARSQVVEGVLVEEGSVISMGVFLGASTKIINRASGEIFHGRVPAYSVVVPGSFPSIKEGDPHSAVAVIVKTVDEKTRSKTSINDLLRSA